MTRTHVGRLAALALAAATVVAACGGTGSSAAPATASADAAPTVRFGVFPNITHAPGLVMLADGGPLAKALPNATIKVESFNSGTKAVEAMFSDAIDITFVGPNPSINAYAQSKGEAVRVIAGSTSGGAFLVVRPEIATAAELKGKKIATPSLGNTQDVALRAWLKDQGFTTDTAGGGDVSVVPQENAQTLETFIAGTIDGAWVPEPWATRLVTEGGAKVLVDEGSLWPDGKYVTTQLMVSTKWLAANPATAKTIVETLIATIDQVNADPAAAQKTVNAEIKKWTSKQLKDEILTAAWGNLTFTIDPIASSLATSAADAQDLGLLKDPGDLKGLYDLTILNDILKAQGKPEVSGL